MSGQTVPVPYTVPLESTLASLPENQTRVPDPDNPYVFEPPGSESESILYGSGFFYQQAKKINSNLYFCCLVTS
jgi:hypothetical protein